MRKSFAFIFTVFLLVFPALQPALAQQNDYVISLQVTERALADIEVTVYVNVRSGGSTVQGIRVTFIVGQTPVSSCITDKNGSCQSGYRFDKAGYYQVTALAGNSSASRFIQIIAPPTPTETETPLPSATPRPGMPLPPSVPPTATLLLPTINIPTSTPTSASPVILATRTPVTPVTFTAPPPTATYTPVPVESLLTFDPGFTPTPLPEVDRVAPIVRALSIVAWTLGGAAVVIIIVRVRKYRELTRLRAKKK